MFQEEKKRTLSHHSDDGYSWWPLKITQKDKIEEKTACVTQRRLIKLTHWRHFLFIYLIFTQMWILNPLDFLSVHYLSLLTPYLSLLSSWPEHLWGAAIIQEKDTASCDHEQSMLFIPFLKYIWFHSLSPSKFHLPNIKLFSVLFFFEPQLALESF